MKLGKYRQHSLLTAADQITSKPQRMFLQREPLLPYWAPMKGLAKIQLTLLPNCKEPDCITLLATLSIPEEVFLSRVQEQSPPRAARSGLQLGNLVCNSWLGWWPEDPFRATGASPPPATNAAPAVHVGVGVVSSYGPVIAPMGWGNIYYRCCLQHCPHGYTTSEALACSGCRTLSTCNPPQPFLKALGLMQGCIPFSHSSVERKSLLHTGKALVLSGIV